ncbi:MAG: peptidoglycan editing factor PgeF, partial [Candidatus Acidiferrales bacterium]
VARHRRALLRALPSPGRKRRWQLVTLRQRHTDFIQVIRRPTRGGDRPPRGRGRQWREPDGAIKLVGDALITDRPGFLLSVQVADCLPILLTDPERKVVAAVHAGWRGTVKRIADKTVGTMRQEFGCDPKKLRAAIGPGIHVCCYEVGRVVLEAFAGQFPYWQKVVRRLPPPPPDLHWQQQLLSPAPTAERRPRPALTSPAAERFYLDLVEANRRQLRAAGLRRQNIWAAPLCTACRTDRLFSHRAEHGRTGRMMGVIGKAG